MILNNKIFIPTLLVLIALACSMTNSTVSENERELTTLDSLVNESNLESEQIKAINDTVFDQNIKTVLLNHSAFEPSQAIINLNSKEQLTLRFDDLSLKFRNLSYNILKCDKHWNLINESSMNYIEGFVNEYIRDEEVSNNTLTDYYHYNLNFPDYNNYKITESGNYVIEVYDDSDTLFRKRFQIVEQLCNISPIIRKASNIMDANYRQEIDFNITTEEIIQNPIRTVEVHLYKNGDIQHKSTELKPKFVEGTTLKYDYDNENIFDGGNEFRSLNLKSTKLLLQYVKHVELIGDTYQVYLYDDVPKTFKTYSFKEDLNGEFLITNEDRPSEPHLNSEYFNVHFTLNYGKPLAEGDFYVFGAISNWKIDERFKLKYNANNQKFECSTLIKQGYYDYEYVYVNGSEFDESKVEGTHFATQNNYTIQVFWIDNYGEERLIGHKTFPAHK